MSNSQSFYSEEEAQRILSIASRNQVSNGMSRDELIRAAAELGISAESIEQAESEIQQHKEAEIREQALKDQKLSYRRYVRNKIVGGLLGYVGFVAMFVTIWALCGGGYFWPIWVIIWPALGFISDFGDFFNPEKQSRRFERWQAKHDPNYVAPIEEQQSAQVNVSFTGCGWRAARRRDRRF